MKVTFEYANLYFNAVVDFIPNEACVILDLQTVRGEDANFMLESDDLFDGLQEACSSACEVLLEGE